MGGLKEDWECVFGRAGRPLEQELEISLAYKFPMERHTSRETPEKGTGAYQIVP